MKKSLVMLLVFIGLGLIYLGMKNLSKPSPRQTKMKDLSYPRKLSSQTKSSTALQIRGESEENTFSHQKAIAVSNAYVLQHTQKLGIQPYHDLIARGQRNPLGTQVTYQFQQEGIPIVGMNLRVWVSRDLQVMRVLNDYAAIAKIDLQGTQILSAQSFYEKLKDSKLTDKLLKPSELTPLIYWNPGSDEGTLAYAVKVKEGNSVGRASALLLFDAQNGETLAKTQGRSERFHQRR